MDIAKARFLFGPDFSGEGELNPEVAEDREKLLAASPQEWPEELLGSLTTVATQVATEEPPAVWTTARRLLAEGHEPGAVLSDLCLALQIAEEAAADEDREVDLAAYVASLAYLPIPDSPALLAAIDQTLRAAKYGLAEAECLTRALRGLGRQVADILTRAGIDSAIGELVSEGTVESLVGDRLVLPEVAIEGSVLTHRLTVDDRALGALRLDDFVGLDDVDAGGFCVVDVDGVGYLRGPEGWLEGSAAGDLVALRLHDGRLTASRVPEPADDPGLVARVRSAAERESARFGLPAALPRICLSLILEDHQSFARPALPLTELCAAAGLEVRGMLAAGDPGQWRAARILGWTSEVLEEFEEEGDVTALLRAFAALEQDQRPAELLREVLDDLLQPERALFLAIQLGSWDGPDAEPTRDGFAAALLGAARRPEQAVVATWLAAVMAEARGDVLAAQDHVQRAVSGWPPWPLAIEWAGWYASDRGNADEAAAYWRRLDPLPSEELAVVERFAGAAVPRLGRNDPCWCGSGRKFKACHLGQPMLAPLPERASWLYQKAWAYMTRTGEDSFRDLIAYGTAAAEDPEDPESVRRAAQDPSTIDVVLTEGGWFSRFLAARGPLLPADEARLARAWARAERTVFEVEDAQPGESVAVVDLRTDEHLTIKEPTFSAEAVPGALVCGRAVPDGDGLVFAGPLVSVTEEVLPAFLEACEEGDGFKICTLYAAGTRGARAAGEGDGAGPG